MKLLAASRRKNPRKINLAWILAGLGVGATVIFVVQFVLPRTDAMSEILGESTQVISPQLASATQDEAFATIESKVNKQWFLIGNEFVTEQEVTYTVTLDENQKEYLQNDTTMSVMYLVQEKELTGTMALNSTDTSFSTKLNIATWQPGTYTLVAQVRSNSAVYTSQSQEIYVSYPVYVTWTIDWEGYDVKDEYLRAMDEISSSHYNIPLTHFFNPRIYTNTTISSARQEYLTSWVLERRDNRGDAIGLHLHMQPDMLAAAGVTPLENPAHWGSNLKDGYDVLTTEYSYEDTVKMLEWSKQIFVQKGLGTPTMYRAGGWYADEETLRAVQATGFVIDSSGRTSYEFGTNKVKGPWDLSITTMPYQMSIEDQNSAETPLLGIWEYPNNGGDSWVFNAAQMIDRFNANYNSKTVNEKKMVTFLSHPEWFHVDQPKLQTLFTHTDGHLYEADKGPVVYTTIEDAYTIW